MRAADMQDFMDAACLALGVSLFTAMNRSPMTRSLSRKRNAVAARRLAIVLARKHGGDMFSYPTIARYFACKSHSSIIEIHQHALALLLTDQGMKESLAAAELILREIAVRAAT